MCPNVHRAPLKLKDLQGWNSSSEKTARGLKSGGSFLSSTGGVPGKTSESGGEGQSCVCPERTHLAALVSLLHRASGNPEKTRSAAMPLQATPPASRSLQKRSGDVKQLLFLFQDM